MAFSIVLIAVLGFTFLAQAQEEVIAESVEEAAAVEKEVECEGAVQNYDTPEATKGDKVCCPVCHATVKVKKKALYVEFEGKKYYVCCKDCSEKLKADPDKFLTPSKATKEAEEESAEPAEKAAE